jgi:hypothetical protein
MLPNVDQALYARFKKEGYRIKKFKEEPVSSITEIVQLGYLDVNRTIKGIKKEPTQAQLFKQHVLSFIGNLLNKPPANQEDFDLLHHRCCQQCIEGNSHGRAHIYYGQAQKLLNMSLKYLYNEFAVYHGKLDQFHFPDNNIEYFFHLPIDNQILSYLVTNCDFAKPTSLPWSQWAYYHYINFQSQLRSRISGLHKPLEIDYILWNTKGASVGNAIKSPH